MAPLRLGNRCLGVISAQSYTERAYDESAVRLLAAIAEQMALAVQNARMFADAENRADRDPLTNIYHHRYLKTRLEEEVKRAERSGATFSVLMLDIDRFKLVNDNFGHPAGDEALRMLTAVLLATCRVSDVVGRYGGDEFLTILVDSDEAHALNVAERIRHGLAISVLELDGAHIPLSASIGVAEYPRDGRTASDLIATADAALYQSKRSGVPVGGPRSPASLPVVLKGNFAPVSELLAALLARDPTTRMHLEQVNQLAERYASVAGYSEAETDVLLLASVLHDVGKIAIPDQVLCKPSGLTSDERRLVKRHPEVGAMLLEHIPGFNEVARTVLHHHERYDGAGYPRGLAGDQIPKLSRVVSIIDAYSAMTDDRPYHKGMPQAAALAELRRFAGTQFDAEMVELFAGLL
jgi:diguanylate cyclase (GGDEF)-like protein